MSRADQMNRALLGGLVARARREAGLTQRALGERAGRPQPWVSGVEHGHMHCRFHDFVAVARAAGVEPAALCARYVELLRERERIARLRWGGNADLRAGAIAQAPTAMEVIKD